MRVREYRPDDLAELLDLWQAGWQVTLPAIDFAARRPGFAIYLGDLLAAGVRLRMAADDHDVPLGFFTLDGQGYLDQIAVRMDQWGRGVAGRLIDDAKALARTQAPGRIHLKVNQANLRAIAFYEREGFVRGAAEVSALSGLPLWNYHWAKA